MAPSAPELPASEGEQAAADASLSRAPPLQVQRQGSADGYIIMKYNEHMHGLCMYVMSCHVM